MQNLHQSGVEGRAGEDRIGHLGVGTPPRGRTLLEQTCTVAVTTREVPKGALLQRSGKSDHLSAIWHPEFLPDPHDDPRVCHLRGVKLASHCRLQPSAADVVRGHR